MQYRTMLAPFSLGNGPKGSCSNPQGLHGTQSYHLRWLDSPGCDLQLTQFFILHKQRVFLLATEQTGLDSADLLPSGLRRQKAGAIKSIIYIILYLLIMNS